MSKEENVVSYYTLCNKLKNVVRSGWKVWNVKRERLESIAEHIYGVQMLAIAMKSEYQYDIDIMKVIMMLSLHELEEIIIGDYIPLEKNNEEKEEEGHAAIEVLLNGLVDKEQIKSIIYEFDERKTLESQFAYHCDKLECALQSKLYDEEGCVDLSNQNGNRIMNNKSVRALLDGGMTWGQMWIAYWEQICDYDDNFRNVSNYALTHKINE